MNRFSLARFLPRTAAPLVASLIAAWPMPARSASLTWNGGAAPVASWSDALNWGGTAPGPNDTLTFAGTLNLIPNNDLAGYIAHRIIFDIGGGNFTLTGNALTLAGTGPAAPVLQNDALYSTQNVNTALTFDGTPGAGFAEINAIGGNLIFASGISLTGNTELRITRNPSIVTAFNGAISGAGRLVLNGTGTTIFNGVNTYTGGTLVNGGKVEVNNAAGLGNLAPAANGSITVASGGQVDFNGLTLTGGGKNFFIAGSGPDGRGALVNDYNGLDAAKAIHSLTLTGNALIGGTRDLDVGANAVGQFLDGGGNTLTINSYARFNIRGPITNLPTLNVNRGFTYLEGTDAPAGTTVNVDGVRTHLGAYLGTSNRTWAGDITLSNGASIGALGSGAAASTLIVGRAGGLLTINGEGRLNPNTVAAIDWANNAGGGAGNIRVDSALAGSGKLLTGWFGTGTNGTTVTLTADSPSFSGPVQITGGGVTLGNGGTTGDLGSTPGVTFTAGGGTNLLTYNRSGTLNLTNTFSGPGSINFDNTNLTVTLNGANTTGGPGASLYATRVRAGTLILGSADALSSRATFEIGGLGIGTGSLTKFNGFSPSVERFDDGGTDTPGVFNRVVNDSAAYATLTFNINNAAPTFGDFGGTLGGTTAAENNFGLTKIGANDWNLAGNSHTYTGLTTINGGTIGLANDTTGGVYGIGVLGAGGSAANGTVVNPGGSFNFNAFSAGTEVFTIAGRGNGYTGNGFENGALRNQSATASLDAIKTVILAADASIGKNGTGTGGDWSIRNTGGTAVLNLAGNTLTKTGNNTVSIADVTGGVGNGNIIVRHGSLALERGTVVGGTGFVRVTGGAGLILNDNTAAVTLTKQLQFNSGILTNANGAHSLAGLSSSGYFSAVNNDAAAALGLGNIAVPTAGAGAYIGTAGTVTIGTINGVALSAGQRLGAGWTAGPTAASAAPAEWDGTKVVPISHAFNTTASNINTATAGTDVLNNLAVSGVNNTLTGDLTIRTLTSERDLLLNNGTLLRIADGALVIRANNHSIQTTAGAIGRLTSGAADGGLFVNIPETIDARESSVRVQVTDNTNPGLPGTFTPVSVIKNGAGSLVNFGGTSATVSTLNNYTGGTIINTGRVVPQFSSFGTGPVVVREGGQIALYNLAVANGAYFSNSLLLSGTGAMENAGTFGAIRFGNNTIFTGRTTLAGDTRLGGDNGVISGVISGAAGIDKTSSGVVSFTAPNTYTGATIITAGTLATSRLANGSLPSGIGQSSGAASNLVFNGGILRYDGPAAAIDRGFTVDLAGGTISSNYHTGGLTLNPSSIVFADGGDRSFSLLAPNRTTNVFDGVLADPNAGRTSFTFGGIGSWQITRDQNFSGSVTVTQSATSFTGGSLIIGNGGTTGSLGKGVAVSLAAASDIVYNRSDAVTLAQTITGAAHSELIQRGSGSLTLGGGLDNASLNLRVENGTVILAKDSSNNVHATGGTVFAANSTLQIAGSGGDQIANGGAVFLTNSTLDLNGRVEGVNRVEGNSGLITNTAPGTAAELRVGTANGASLFTGTFIPQVIGATGTGGFGGQITDGAGTVALSKEGTGLVALRGDNSFTGGTTILEGTLQVGRQGTTGSLGTGAIFLGGGNSGSIGTLLVDRKGTLALNQTISGPGSVVFQGEGEVRLSGVNAWEGNTTLRRGTLTADLSRTDNVLPVLANYNLEGGTLNIVGRKSGTSLQNFAPAGIIGGNSLFNVGGTNFVGDNNGGTLVVSLPNTWTRNVGGSVDFSAAGAGTTIFKTGIANSNGIIAGAASAFATFGGNTWAVQNNSVIGGLAAAGYNTAAGHLDLPAGNTAAPGGVVGATLRFNAAGSATVDLGGALNTIAQGGVLVTPAVGANTVSIVNGTVGTGGNELIVHQHNTAGDLNIGALFTGTTALTKAGAGRLILSGASTSTGAVAINQGTLEIANGGVAPTGAMTNDGALVVTRNDGTFAAPAALTNTISGSGTLLVQSGTGWVNMNRAANTFTGGVTVSSGYLNNYLNNSGQVAPVILGDASTGSNPVALLYNQTAVTNLNYPIIVSADGSGPVIIGSSGGTGAVGALYNGTLELNRPTTLTSYSPDRATFTNSITGNVGTLTIDVGTAANPVLPGATLPAVGGNNRRVTIEGENSFVGNVEVRNASVLQIGFGTAGVFRDQIPDASNVSLFDAGSTLQFNYEGEVINNFNGDIGTVVKSIAAGGAHMVFSVNGGTFNGQYDGGGGLYIEKNGAGTFSLGGTADNPSGRFRMNSGTLELNKSVAGSKAIAIDFTVNGGLTKITGATGDQIWDGTVVTVNGGTIDLNGQNETIAVLQGIGGNITNTAAGTTSTLTIGDAGNNFSSVYYGTINDGAGAVGLTKNLGHILSLGGNNNISGTTTVNAGTLQIGAGGATGSLGSGPIVTAANTTVVFDRTTDLVASNAVSGSGKLVQQGTGKVTLTGNSSYTGITAVYDGKLEIGNGGTTGTPGTGNITVGSLVTSTAELIFNRSDTLTLTQSIGGTGTVRQAGGGTTILTGASLYSGNTEIDSGTLRVDGSIEDSLVKVNTGGTLGGNGFVERVALDGGTVNAGASPGILTTGNVVTLTSGTFAFEIGGLNAGTGYDRLATNGTVSLGLNSVLSISLVNGFNPTYGDKFLIWTNDLADPFGGIFAGVPEGGTVDTNWVVTYQENTMPGADGNDVSVTYVPEPGTAALAGIATAMLLRRRRRSA